jgi:predicted outer membrane protein
MRSTRFVTGSALVAGAVVVTVAALVYPSMSGLQSLAANPDANAVSTQWGPMTPDDKSFVIKVRLAGLWESPAGQMALQKGTTEAVKNAGRHLIDGHAQLDAADRTVATQLGIALPDQPTPQQQGFLTTLSSSQGTDFDKNLADILRITHGQIFSAIAKEQASTKNTLVRELAVAANLTVADHMAVLEKTGDVDFNAIVPQITGSPTVNPADTVPPTPAAGAPTVPITTTPGATNAPTFPPIDGSIGQATSSPAP